MLVNRTISDGLHDLSCVVNFVKQDDKQYYSERDGCRARLEQSCFFGHWYIVTNMLYRRALHVCTFFIKSDCQFGTKFEFQV